MSEFLGGDYSDPGNWLNWAADETDFYEGQQNEMEPLRQRWRSRRLEGDDEDYEGSTGRAPNIHWNLSSRDIDRDVAAVGGKSDDLDLRHAFGVVTESGQSRAHYNNVAKAFEAQKEKVVSQQRAANLQKAKLLGVRGLSMNRSRVREHESTEMVPFRPRVHSRDAGDMVEWGARPNKIMHRSGNASSDIIDIDTSDPRWRRKRPREDPEPDYFSQPRAKRAGFFDTAEDVLDKVHRGVKRAHRGFHKARDIMSMVSDVANIGTNVLSDYEMLNNAGMIAYDQPSPYQLAAQASQGTGGQMGYDDDKDEALQIAKLRASQGRRTYKIDDRNPPPSKTTVAYTDVVHRGICIDEGSRYQKVMCTDFVLRSNVVNWYGPQTVAGVTTFTTPVSASPNTTNTVVLNDIAAGSDIFNRIGRRIEMVRLEIRGIFTYASETPTASQDLEVGNCSRILLVLDKQPNVNSPYVPGIDSVLKCYNNGGGADWNPFACYNPDNANRFDILYDTLIACQDSVEIAASGAQTEAKTRTFDINLKLNNISTRYKDDNGLWESIASNQLILMITSNCNNRHVLNQVVGDPDFGKFGYFGPPGVSWNTTDPTTDGGCFFKFVGSASLNFQDA